MKIAIVGASSSIMREGWGRFLQEIAPPEFQIDVFSLGGSPSLYGAFAVDFQKIPENYDVALLDFSTNDQQMIDIKLMTPAYVAAAYAAMLRRFAEPGGRCSPIAILKPQRDHVGHRRADQAYRIALGLCRRYGAPTIDFFRALRDLAAEEEIDTRPMFLDWAHFAPFAQKAVAQAALRAIRRVPPKTAPSQKILEEAPCCFAIPAQSVVWSASERRKIGTQLVTYETTSLKPGASGVLEGAPYLCGVLHWIDKDSGPLCFTGSEGVRVKKALRKEWTKLFGLTFLSAPLAAEEGRIQVKFEDDPDYPLERGYGMTPTTPVAGDRAEVVGFLVADEDMFAVGDKLLGLLGDLDTPLPSGPGDGLGVERLLLSSWVKSGKGGAVVDDLESEEIAPPAVVRSTGSVSILLDLPKNARRSVELPFQTGAFLLMSEVSLLRAMIGFRIVGPPQLHNMGAPAPNVALHAGPLPEIPAAKHLSLGLRDGRLEIENRRGGAVKLSIIMFG